ncbi:MAG: PD-(D/E)XK nuclease-like domain-containing protein [Propionibacteriaceae bacterium]|nr:PD-(D/E)XK nuclease-like domain-containing protein [Propionibacteriaceae bacterium]
MTLEPTTPAEAEHVGDHRAMLAQAVATLEPGQTVEATFSPMYRGTYKVTGVTVAPDGEPSVLTLGGWERIRLATGLPPAYLADLAIVPEPFQVTEPGVFYDMPEALYHSGPTPTPSLSYSGAKVLLAGPPGRYFHQLTHRQHKAAWDFGHAWHSLILGKGDPVVEVRAKDWRTKAAQEARANAYDRGFVPLLTHEVETARRMADRFLDDPEVAALLADGVPEVSMFGLDPVTGSWIRGRIDWVNGDLGAFVDVKTTTDASAAGFNKSVEKFGYAMQAAWYGDLAEQLPELPDVDRFVFAAQEKDAPYFPHVFELNADWLAIGRHLNRQALDLFAECLAADQWPGYGPGITTLAPPAWLARRFLAEGAEAARDHLATVGDPVPLSPEFEAALARMAGLPTT